MNFFLATAHAASEHAHEAAHATPGHLTNLIGLIAGWMPGPAGDFLLAAENVIFMIIPMAILAAIFYFASRKITLVPGKLQLACETIVEGLAGFVTGILGPGGKKHTPFLGTLFLWILANNLIGLVPLMKSNTANAINLPGPVQLPIPTMTVALALIVFIYVQAVGIKNFGLLGYLDHMAGQPRDIFGWVMVPIMFPIHVIGEFAKPFSLTFRLFCNMMGGHILVGVFVGMAVGAAFIPFQAPFLLFEIATSTIQAFVFTLLSTVYVAMMMPHDEATPHVKPVH